MPSPNDDDYDYNDNEYSCCIMVMKITYICFE